MLGTFQIGRADSGEEGPVGAWVLKVSPEERFVKYGGKFCYQIFMPHSHLSVSKLEIASDISIKLLAALVL